MLAWTAWSYHATSACLSSLILISSFTSIFLSLFKPCPPLSFISSLFPSSSLPSSKVINLYIYIYIYHQTFIYIYIYIVHICLVHAYAGTYANKYHPVGLIEYKLYGADELNTSNNRRILEPFQQCLECRCCSAGDPTSCSSMSCCFGIDCNLPDKPYGVCAFVPKTCNCTSCV